MRRIKECMVGLGILLSAWLGAAAVNAEGKLAAAPTLLAVAGTRGAIETRTLLLRATDPITSLQAIPLDLVRADNTAALPAAAIRVALPADQIPAGGLLAVPVTFDLRNAPGGEFSGQVLINYHEGALNIPVTVTVKEPWPLPLFVLLVGVALGLGVSAYRAQGKPRDQVLVRVNQLHAQMRADALLAAPFQTRIQAYTVDVESALLAERWEDAQKAIEKEETIWAKWRKGHEDWQRQLEYQGELTQRLGALNSDAMYVQVVRRALQDAARDAPDLEAPDELRDRLDALAQQINRYLQLQARLDELNGLRNRLPPDQSEPWRPKALNWQQRLDTLAPTDQAAYQTLQNEVEDGTAELTKLVAQLGGEAKGPRDVGAAIVNLIAPAPSARPLTFEAQATSARARLRLFTWASYAVAVALLAGAGFGELYIVKPTFGANAWGDYFSLLAWGFGAEATRAAVADLIKSWGLPGAK